MFKKIVILLSLVLSPVSAFAQSLSGGGIGPRNVMPELRTQTLVIPNYQLTTAADVTLGLDGVVVADSFAAGAIFHLAGTSSIAAFPYACALQAYIVDVSSDTTPTCTSVTVVGYDQFGVRQRETISTLVEAANIGATNTTAVAGNIAFESLDSYSVTDCQNNDADDVFILSCSPKIGLQYRITGNNAVLSWCVAATADGASNANYCYRPASADAANYAYDNAGASNRVSTTYFTFDTLDSSNLVGPTDDDTLVFRIRAPNGAR